MGFAETNSIRYFILGDFLLTPKPFFWKIISFINLFQKEFLNFILINPGLTVVIVSISSSFFFINSANSLAISRGGFLLTFDKIIAALVEMSQLNCWGGTSTFMPPIFSGSWIELFNFGLLSKLIIFSR